MVFVVTKWRRKQRLAKTLSMILTIFIEVPVILFFMRKGKHLYKAKMKLYVKSKIIYQDWTGIHGEILLLQFQKNDWVLHDMALNCLDEDRWEQMVSRMLYKCLHMNSAPFSSWKCQRKSERFQDFIWGFKNTFIYWSEINVSGWRVDAGKDSPPSDLRKKWYHVPCII